MSDPRLDTLAAIIDVFDAAGVEHMLAGSFASSHHAVPRSTADIDLVIEVNDGVFDRLLAALRGGRFYLPAETARREYEVRGQFNLIDTTTGWKIDLIFCKDRPFSRTEFSRRQWATVAGVELYVATAEDTILAKLEWALRSESERQLHDAVEILYARAADLDNEHLDRWAREIGVEQLLAQARAAAGRT